MSEAQAERPDQRATGGEIWGWAEKSSAPAVKTSVHRCMGMQETTA